MGSSRKLRVALIGQGFMGRAHSNAYRQVGRFFDLPFEIETKLLWGRNEVNLPGMAARWGWLETAVDWRQAVDRADIDVVDIATPNSSHAEMAIAAARAGKIVLCEKPLALNAAESARMVEAAAGVRTMVWFNYRRVPAIAFSRRLIDEGRIGRVYHYRGQYLQEWGNDPMRPPSWKTDAATAGSGVLGDLLSHSVDTALYLNGPIREVTAMQHAFVPGRAIDDATLAMVRFENGSIGSFESTRYATGAKNRNSFEMHGEKGALRFNLEDMNRLEFVDATEARNLQGARSLLVTGPDHPFAANFWKPAHIIGYEHTFIAALAEFLEAVANGRPFHPDFADGHRVQMVLDAMAESSARGVPVVVNG